MCIMGVVMETFVVRLWVPGEETPAGDGDALRGVVEHAASAASATFVGSGELLRFLEGVLEGGQNGGGEVASQPG
jgi:hypothetical protein